jgi:hypothetical protein
MESIFSGILLYIVLRQVNGRNMSQYTVEKYKM